MRQPQRFRFRPAKFRGLVLYIVEQHTNRRESCTYQRLSTLLYLIEHEHYGQFGKPIAGSSFVKAPWGPDCKQLPAALDSLVASGAIAYRPVARPYFCMV